MLVEPSVGGSEGGGGDAVRDAPASGQKWWEDGSSNSADIFSPSSVLVTLTSPLDLHTAE